MIARLRIPDERMPVLIGRDGTTKQLIEESTSTSIAVSDEIAIEGEVDNVLTAENIIRAIGRGFVPEDALELLDENVTLFVIQLPKEKNTLVRLKSRIIGTRGKARRNIERLTKTTIAVYGKTVAAIGTYDNVETARRAIEMLIKGRTHKTVYKFLEDRHA